MAQARNFYKQNVINCVQKDPKGDPKYNITESEQLKDADGNK